MLSMSLQVRVMMRMTMETTGTCHPPAENSDTRCCGNQSGSVAGFRATSGVYRPGRIWIHHHAVQGQRHANRTRLHISGSDEFHRKLRMEVAKERGIEVK
jgi:hypothetical protein